MKHNLRKIISAVVLIAASASLWAQNTALSASVVSVKGKVEVNKGSGWSTLSAGDMVYKGAIISTGYNSSAVLKVGSSNVTLGALTRITMEQLAQTDKKEETKMYLDSGKVSFDVKHTAQRRADFKVRSPAATASVRGTSGTVYANGRVDLTEGALTLNGSTSDHAQVQEDPTDFVPEEGESTVFTPTTDVSGRKGIPIYGGQTGFFDSHEGTSTTPLAHAQDNSGASQGSTTPQTKVEAVGTNYDDDRKGAKYASITINVNPPQGN